MQGLGSLGMEVSWALDMITCLLEGVLKKGGCEVGKFGKFEKLRKFRKFWNLGSLGSLVFLTHLNWVAEEGSLGSSGLREV